MPGSGTNFFEGGVFAELFVAWVLFRAECGTPAGVPRPSLRAGARHNAPRFLMRLALKESEKSLGAFPFFLFGSGEFFEQACGGTACEGFY